MLINPNIDTFISKFELTEHNQSSYISILSLVNPLGGLVGVFIAKSLVSYLYKGYYVKYRWRKGE